MDKKMEFESDRYQKRQALKRILIPVCAVLAVIVIVVIVALVTRKSKGVVYKAGEDSLYPVTWTDYGNGTLLLEIDHSAGKDQVWNISEDSTITAEGILDVKEQELQSANKSSFMLTAENLGRASLVFLLTPKDDSDSPVAEMPIYAEVLTADAEEASGKEPKLQIDLIVGEAHSVEQPEVIGGGEGTDYLYEIYPENGKVVISVRSDTITLGPEAVPEETVPVPETQNVPVTAETETQAGTEAEAGSGTEETAETEEDAGAEEVAETEEDAGTEEALETVYEPEKSEDVVMDPPQEYLDLVEKYGEDSEEVYEYIRQFVLQDYYDNPNNCNLELLRELFPDMEIPEETAEGVPLEEETSEEEASEGEAPEEVSEEEVPESESIDAETLSKEETEEETTEEETEEYLFPPGFLRDPKNLGEWAYQAAQDWEIVSDDREILKAEGVAYEEGRVWGSLKPGKKVGETIVWMRSAFASTEIKVKIRVNEDGTIEFLSHEMHAYTE